MHLIRKEYPFIRANETPAETAQSKITLTTMIEVANVPMESGISPNNDNI